MAFEEVDLALEVDVPLVSSTRREPDPTSADIGERVADLVSDRAPLQLGIGGVLGATVVALHDRRGLRGWTEMVRDGLLGLDGAGALDP